MEALSNGKNEEARQHAQKAANLDPNFGTAYGIMAAASEGLDEHDEAVNYSKLAVARLQRVTERERYRIRGLSFLLSGDKQKCVEEYSELIKRYAADTAAHNNLGICAKHLRKLDTAIEESQQAVKMLPKRALYRVNLALHSSYASNFVAGEREAREVQKLIATYPASFNALVFSQLGQGQVAEAAQTYQNLEKIRASEAAAGLGDLALYEGRLSDAAPDAEFDRCIKRRGESMALFLDEVPTHGYFPPVYYYLGRVREQNGAEFQESYRAYLNIRGNAGEGPRLPEIRKRVGG
jgi:tetratricopeptide (TPR) repeat protein